MVSEDAPILESRYEYHGYIVEIYYYGWSCGDGCCSESGYYPQVTEPDGKVVMRWEDQDYRYSESAAESAAEEFIDRLVRSGENM